MQENKAGVEKEVEGPTLTDENCELDVPYLSCRGCTYLRVHDWHYFYCRDLGDKSKPDFDPYNRGLKRIWSFPEPDNDCRFIRNAGSNE